ncbi:MAG: insulinase family protein [Erysipelotrichaceae bacterium]|jgi:predicted Zn-dependent peptidase|nr:insulinase family protein [Erysipelotrichaceae bacterium]
MKTITHPEFGESAIVEVLDNGLQVTIYHKPEFATSCFAFGTPYGAFDYKQNEADGSIFEVPLGAAHFLEHKLFEKPEEDMLSKFNSLGANVNAFTTESETVYFFTITTPEYQKPLNLLLDFVQDLQIDDASVEKEKGIIVEELLMYEQIPNYRLYREAMSCLFENHPLKYDVGGTTDSVVSTTRKELEDCHQRNYHPSRMQFLAITPCDPEEVLQVIKANQAKKDFGKPITMRRFPVIEPESVVKKEVKVDFDIPTTKSALVFKLNLPQSDLAERERIAQALNCALQAQFSTLNPQYQLWIDEKIINEFFGFEVNIGKDYGYVMFFGETADPQSWRDFLLKQIEEMKKNPVDSAVLAQLKKRTWGNALSLFDKPSAIVFEILRSDLYGLSFFETQKITRALTVDNCVDSLKYVKDIHSSLVILGKI